MKQASLILLHFTSRGKLWHFFLSLPFLSYISKYLPERKEVRITEQCLDESPRKTLHNKKA